MPAELLNMFVVYDHPKDYPAHFVVRRFEYDRPTDDVQLFASLHDLRLMMMYRGLSCLTRNPEDDPVIVETWL